MNLAMSYSPPLLAPMLARDEIAFRAPYRDLLVRRLVTTVFRPGNRVFPRWRGYKPGEVVTARVIEVPGSDELGVPPLFQDLRIPVRIVGLSVTPIGALERSAFAGSSPDVHDVESLIAHLHEIYRRPLQAFGNQVTRIALAYLD